MSLLNTLKTNKGTTSSALGKELAKEVLAGNTDLLKEAVGFVIFEPAIVKSKNVRAGAAKIIQLVAEKKPELVAPYLEQLLPALELPEPQTRWMIIRILGFCSKLNTETAARGIPFARSYIEERQGICLSGAAEVYLGHIGSQSPALAEKVLPILLDAYANPLPNEVDWILEGFIGIIGQLSDNNRKPVLDCANEQLSAFRKSTQKRAEKILNNSGNRI